jgi:hypothetical protein
MAISTYQVDSVIKAYSKQSRMKVKHNLPPDKETAQRYVDVVSLSTQNETRTDAYRKISYSLLDAILKEGGE